MAGDDMEGGYESDAAAEADFFNKLTGGKGNDDPPGDEDFDDEGGFDEDEGADEGADDAGADEGPKPVPLPDGKCRRYS